MFFTQRLLLVSFLVFTLLLSGCVGTRKLELEGDFPVPIMQKSAVRMGIHLDDEITSYRYTEKIESVGEWIVVLGPIQKPMFARLGEGVFNEYRFVETLDGDQGLDGALKPSIKEVQFSLPRQTRSDYYEVWIRYQFHLYDRAGNLIGEWDLPAYGKASKKNFGSHTRGLEGAAIAASRDAMAFFSINFAREPIVRKWMADGMPIIPQTNVVPPQAVPAGASAQPAIPPNNSEVPSSTAGGDPT